MVVNLVGAVIRTGRLMSVRKIKNALIFLIIVPLSLTTRP